MPRYTVAELELNDVFASTRSCMSVLPGILLGGLMFMGVMFLNTKATYQEDSSGGRYYVGYRNHFDRGPHDLNFIFTLLGCLAAGVAIAYAITLVNRMRMADQEQPEQLFFPFRTRRIQRNVAINSEETPLIGAATNAQQVSVVVAPLSSQVILDPAFIPYYHTGLAENNNAKENTNNNITTNSNSNRS